MRTRVKVHPNLTISLALSVLLLAGCSSSGPSSEKPEPSAGTGTPSSAAPRAAVGAGVTVGRVAPSARTAAVSAVGDAVERWIDAAYLTPSADVAAAFPGFTPRAAKLAARDRGVTTFGGTAEAALVPEQSSIKVDLLGTEGKARGATARVALTLDPEGEDKGPTKISGRVTLVPEGHGWRIFGYELRRQSPDTRSRRVMAGDPGGTGVLWIMAVGSDARPGQPPLRSRGDALQLVGINPMTGAATTIGIPRDSWVSIPGSGSNRINASLYFGGPKLLGRTVGNLVGVQPDHVFVATFSGLINMVDDIGSIVVQSDIAFSDNPLRPQGFRKGKNRLAGRGALAFSRIRHDLPRGDFQRSAHQQETLRAIQAAIGLGIAKPGFLEKGTFSAHRNLSTGLSIGQLFRIAQTVASIDTRKTSGCVVQGSIGNVNGASIVFPNTAAARRYGNDARKDATIKRC
jgi:LCP family protein required for cell wall assembly